MRRTERITIQYAGPSATGKTDIYHVLTNDGADLGRVVWFGRWRCYAFAPLPDTIYERQCLRDIADFCEQLTTEHRESRTPEGGRA